MYPVKTATAVTSRPAYTEGGAPGFFTAGNAVAGIPATAPGEHWFNMTQEELLNVIRAAGLTPSATDDTQLVQAIAALIAAHAITVAPASETVAGIIKLASNAQALAGTDDTTAMSPADVAAAVAGMVRAYTRQQSPAPVVRTGASGSQAVDMDLHQLLTIAATGALAFAAPEHLAVGKTCTIIISSAAAVALTYDGAYVDSLAYARPVSTTAGKALVLRWYCHKPGVLMLTGVAEEL